MELATGFVRRPGATQMTVLGYVSILKQKDTHQVRTPPQRTLQSQWFQVGLFKFKAAIHSTYPARVETTLGRERYTIVTDRRVTLRFDGREAC